ncbi:MAG: glycosyltransferase family 2 protein [Lentisphaerae bacterium]|nr:glycosyltransferase family 2 protein [Lentisphaerota bacterium]
MNQILRDPAATSGTAPAYCTPVESMNATATPLISVIVPAYNAAATIRDALASVEEQGRADAEVIVVDDASRDDTPRILQAEYAARPGYQILALARNAGPAAARNRAIQRARGTWLAFLDGDDAWLPDRLAVQLAVAERQPDVALWCGATVPLDDRPVPTRAPGPPPQRDLPLREFVYHNVVATSTVLVRRAALVAVGGFDEQFIGPEDYDLWMRLAQHHRLVRFEAPLARYRLVPGSLSMDDRKFLPQVLRVLDKGFSPGGVLAHHIALRTSSVATQYWNASWMAFNRGARGVALQYWWQAYRLDHRSELGATRPWGRLLLRYLAGKPEVQENGGDRRLQEALGVDLTGAGRPGR